MNIYLQIELDEGQECGVWLPPQENCCGACSCETGTIICPYGREPISVTVSVGVNWHQRKSHIP